jgi:hypothetical protein
MNGVALTLVLIAAVGLFVVTERKFERRIARARWDAVNSPDHNPGRVVAYYARLAVWKARRGDEPPFLPRFRRGVTLQTELALTGRIHSATH